MNPQVEKYQRKLGGEECLAGGRHLKCLLILLTRSPRSTPTFSGIKGITISMPTPDTHDKVGQVPRARCRRISNNAPFLAHRNDVNGVAPGDRSSTKHPVMLWIGGRLPQVFFPRQVPISFRCRISLLLLSSLVVIPQLYSCPCPIPASFLATTTL